MSVSSDLPTLTCQDCTAVGTKTLNHDPSCPTLIGTEKICSADAAFFATRPGCRWRWRDGVTAERSELRAVGLDLTGHPLRVLVRDLGDQRHERLFHVRRQLIAACVDVPPTRGWAT